MMGQLIQMRPLQEGDRVALPGGATGTIDYFTSNRAFARVSYLDFQNGTDKPSTRKSDLFALSELHQFAPRPSLRLAAYKGVLITQDAAEPTDPVEAANLILAQSMAGKLDPDDPNTIARMESLSRRLRTIALEAEAFTPPDNSPGAA